MTEKQHISDEYIIDCLSNDYGIRVTTLTFIPLGADINASVYKAQTNDHKSYFVKLKYESSQNIGAIVQLELHNAGIQQIISPIKTNSGQPTCDKDDFTLIVYPFIEGQDGFSRSLTNEQWIILGKALKQVHTFNLSSPIKNQIKQESYSAKWREAVRTIFFQIDQEQLVNDTTAFKLLTFMKQHRQTIQRLVNRAELLTIKIQKESPKFVLCHSDIHAGNVLIAHDGAIYIIDWDQPMMAPKERDLMFIGGGVGNVWNNPRDEKFFYEGYGKTKINTEILAYYRCERIVEDIALYSQQLFFKNGGGKDREIMYKQFIDMFEPNGVVDIAFKTKSNL